MFLRWLQVANSRTWWSTVSACQRFVNNKQLIGRITITWSTFATTQKCPATHVRIPGQSFGNKITFKKTYCICYEINWVLPSSDSKLSPVWSSGRRDSTSPLRAIRDIPTVVCRQWAEYFCSKPSCEPTALLRLVLLLFYRFHCLMSPMTDCQWANADSS